jgi:hypothetical protein
VGITFIGSLTLRVGDKTPMRCFLKQMDGNLLCLLFSSKAIVDEFPRTQRRIRGAQSIKLIILKKEHIICLSYKNEMHEVTSCINHDRGPTILYSM